MASSLRDRCRIDYKLLSEGESLSLRKTYSIIKKSVLEETFYVERLIWKRKDTNQDGHEYLVKWQDYRTYDCTWEPERNLPTSVISSFIEPHICDTRLSEFATSFERAIQTRLKSTNPKCAVYVDLDVYRYVFGSEKCVLFNLEDFDKLNLSFHWFYNLHRDGTGRKIKFPIKVSVRLSERKLFVKINGKLTLKTMPIERCSVFSCTEACSTDDA